MREGEKTFGAIWMVAPEAGSRKGISPPSPPLRLFLSSHLQGRC